jgi:hypothetical protein
METKKEKLQNDIAFWQNLINRSRSRNGDASVNGLRELQLELLKERLKELEQNA